jgi:hypothetical protein
MRKLKSAPSDHDTECINSWKLYDFYFANMDLILWLKPGIPFNVIVTTDVFTMLGKSKAGFFVRVWSSYSMATTRHLKETIIKLDPINILYQSTHYHFHQYICFCILSFLWFILIANNVLGSLKKINICYPRMKFGLYFSFIIMFNTFLHNVLFRNQFFSTQKKLDCHLITEWQINFIKHSYLILSYLFYHGLLYNVYRHLSSWERNACFFFTQRWVVIVC